MMCILNGLGRDYDNFVISAYNREVSFTFAEIKARLLNHEQWIHEQQHDQSSQFDSQNASAFYGRNVQNGNGFGSNKNKNRGSKPPVQFKNSTYHIGSSSHSHTSGDGNRRTSMYFSQVECQICRKTGHYASRCFFRYAPPKPVPPTANVAIKFNHMSQLINHNKTFRNFK